MRLQVLCRLSFRHLCCFSISVLSIAAFASAAEDPSPSESLRQGLYAEEVSRDPDAAAKHYAQIIAQEDQRRATVATAVFRLAEVKRGQGKKEEAITLYQRLLREFPQAEIEGKLAREHLTALGGKIPAPGAVVIDEEAAELSRLRAAATDSPDLVSDAGTLFVAAKNGWLKVVEFLLANGANPYDPKETPFEVAVDRGHLAICRAMLAKAGLPPLDMRRAALDAAIDSRRWTILRFLVDQGISPDVGIESGSDSALATAAGNEESADSLMRVRLLLDLHADPNAVAAAVYGREPGLSPLHCALQKGNFKTAEILLEHGAKLNLVDNGKQVAELNLTVIRPGPEAAAMVVKLIDHGAKVNALARAPQKNPLGPRPRVPGKVFDDLVSPLQLAVDHQAWDSAKVLIARGADLKQPGLLTRYLPENAFADDEPDERARINAKSSFLSSLMSSRDDDSLLTERLRFLLEAGADPNLLDERGHHPLSLIVLAGKPELLALFLKHGADPDIPFGKDPGKLPPPPLRAAAERRNAAGLLNYGLNPTWRTGSTSEAQVEIVRLLLKADGKPGTHAAALIKLVAGHDPDGSLTRALQKDAPADPNETQDNKTQDAR